MNAFPGSLLTLAVLLAACLPAAAQSIDDSATGFLNPRTGGVPTDSRAGATMANARRLVAALPVAPLSGTVRDLQFRVLVSELTPPPVDGSAPPSLFARRVERLAAMGEGESLNELGRSPNAYGDAAIATTTANALMMSGERAGGCNVARHQPMPEGFGRRAGPTCLVVAGQMGAAQKDRSTGRRW